MNLPIERRRQLQELGLRALVKRKFGELTATPVPFAAGVALVTDDFAAVFADDPRGLGSAIDTTHREGRRTLYFFSELNTADVARRASEFAVDVIVIDPAGEFEPIEPAPRKDDGPDKALEPAAARLRAAGLDVVWEDGAVLGEWLGLEVARATRDRGLEVGVGRHDREANQLLNPDGPPDALILSARSTVEGLRRPGAPVHPANQLGPERWLRTVLLRHPELVGAKDLQPFAPPTAREDLKQRSVAPAAGTDNDGQPVVVVCSAGIDPDLVPQAADARVQAPNLASRLKIAIPHVDDHPLTQRLARLLKQPAEIVLIRDDWKSVG